MMLFPKPHQELESGVFRTPAKARMAFEINTVVVFGKSVEMTFLTTKLQTNLRAIGIAALPLRISSPHLFLSREVCAPRTLLNVLIGSIFGG